MKLWWPHTEALYALLLAYSLTQDKKYWDWYTKIHDWTFQHFPDPQYGEWFAISIEMDQFLFSLKETCGRALSIYPELFVFLSPF